MNETLGLAWFTPAEVRRLVLANEIPDGLTVTALSWALVAGTRRLTRRSHRGTIGLWPGRSRG